MLSNLTSVRGQPPALHSSTVRGPVRVSAAHGRRHQLILNSSPVDAIDAVPSDVPTDTGKTDPAESSLGLELLRTINACVGEGYRPFSREDKRYGCIDGGQSVARCVHVSKYLAYLSCSKACSVLVLLNVEVSDSTHPLSNQLTYFPA